MALQTRARARRKPQIRGRRTPMTIGRVIGMVLATAWLVVTVYPILYIVMTSIRSQNGYLTGQPWLPSIHPTWSNFSTVLDAGIFRSFLNSALVSVSTVILIVAFALFLSYVIVRTRARVVTAIFNTFLVGLAIPIQAAIIPVYILINRMGLYDTLIGMVLPMVAFGLPLTVLILVNFVRDVPNELYEAMGMEGANDFQMVWKLVVPLARSAIIAIGIYEFIQSWNNFLFPLVLTQSPNVRVLPLAIYQFQGQYTMDVPATMAVVILSALPLLLAYIFGSRYLRQGMLAGFSK